MEATSFLSQTKIDSASVAKIFVVMVKTVLSVLIIALLAAMSIIAVKSLISLGGVYVDTVRNTSNKASIKRASTITISAEELVDSK